MIKYKNFIFFILILIFQHCERKISDEKNVKNHYDLKKILEIRKKIGNDSTRILKMLKNYSPHKNTSWLSYSLDSLDNVIAINVLLDTLSIPDELYELKNLKKLAINTSKYLVFERLPKKLESLFFYIYKENNNYVEQRFQLGKHNNDKLEIFIISRSLDWRKNSPTLPSL